MLSLGFGFRSGLALGVRFWVRSDVGLGFRLIMKSLKRALRGYPEIKCLKKVQMLSKMTPKKKIANILKSDRQIISRTKQHSIIHAHMGFCLDKEIK